MGEVEFGFFSEQTTTGQAEFHSIQRLLLALILTA